MAAYVCPLCHVTDFKFTGNVREENGLFAYEIECCVCGYITEVFSKNKLDLVEDECIEFDVDDDMNII